MGFYFKIIKGVIEGGIQNCADKYSLTRAQVLERIFAQIQSTAGEHRTATPNIPYHDPFCRLGYLYHSAGMQASLFRRTILESKELRALIKSRAGQTIRICCLGEGPGTELLGLSKHFSLDPDSIPRKIDFTIIDNTQQWSETGRQFVNAIENEFRLKGVDGPSVNRSFLSFNALDLSSYEDYVSEFQDIDIVISNYFLSENTTKVIESEGVWNFLARTTPEHCIYVVIDRDEVNTQFVGNVRNAFESAFKKSIEIHTRDHRIGADEDVAIDFGDELPNALQSPRLKATAFWFTVRQGAAR